MDHVAIYFLRCVEKRRHFCRPLLHKIQYLVFHLDVALGSPSLDPLGNRQLHLCVRQFYPNCFSFDFELANDPEKEDCFPAEGVFFVLQAEPSQVCFSDRVQESVQSEQFKHTLFHNLLLLAQSETHLSLVFFELELGDERISLLGQLVFVLQTVLKGPLLGWRQVARTMHIYLTQVIHRVVSCTSCVLYVYLKEVLVMRFGMDVFHSIEHHVVFNLFFKSHGSPPGHFGHDIVLRVDFVG